MSRLLIVIVNLFMKLFIGDSSTDQNDEEAGDEKQILDLLRKAAPTSRRLMDVVVLLVVVVIGAKIWIRFTPPLKGQWVEITPGSGHYRLQSTLPDGSRQVMDSVGRGRPLSLYLPDSSKVKLCYGSSLRYPAIFDGVMRDVYLNGQASFDVRANSSQPFVVHCGSTIVRVVGTYFNVTGYRGEATCKVTLVSGAVQVIHDREACMLKPREQAIIGANKAERIPVRTLEHPIESVDWYDRWPYLYFEDEDVNELILKLARYYQVSVYNPEDIKGLRMTGVLSLEDSLDVNLRRIALIEHGFVHIEIRDDFIVLTNDKPHK